MGYGSIHVHAVVQKLRCILLFTHPLSPPALCSMHLAARKRIEIGRGTGRGAAGSPVNVALHDPVPGHVAVPGPPSDTSTAMSITAARTVIGIETGRAARSPRKPWMGAAGARTGAGGTSPRNPPRHCHPYLLQLQLLQQLLVCQCLRQ
jgi:hypothetical protein